MTDDEAVERAVAAMKDLGLTEYQARCFVGLLRSGRATAREVSQITNVPRSRVYDLADTLSDRGLAVTYNTTPRTFQAVGPETALDALERDHRERIESATEALEGVERTEPSPPPQEGGATVTGRQRVFGQCRQLIETADREVLVLVGSGRDLGTISESLTAALERGVSVLVGVHDPDVRARLVAEYPEMTVFEPLPSWREFTNGVVCALLVDRDAVLVSTHHEGRKVAVWDRGTGLATVLVPILERQARHARGRNGD